VANKMKWKGILMPDVAHQRAKRGKLKLPIGPVLVESETWFAARQEVCRLLLAGQDEVEVLRLEP
jgi:hypothetical protein